MKIFIKIKPLSLFLLMFGIPFLMAIFYTILNVPPYSSKIHIWGALIVAYMDIIFLWWMFSVGRYLSESIGTPFGHWYRLFKYGIFYIFLILCIVMLLLLYSISNIGETVSTILLFMLGLGVFILYYLFGYLSKMIVSLEKGKESMLLDYFAVFAALLFLPIGIWYVQPKINNIYAKFAP